MPFFRRIASILVCFAIICATSNAQQRADSVVNFNEIHYHPAGTDEPEWVELHNQMAVRVDLSGWSISAGIDFTFPEGTVMEPRSYVVIAADPAHASLVGIANVFGPFAGSLDNGGESLRLRGRHRRIMDELDYADGGKWSTAPDGGGVTLTKLDPGAPSGRPASWMWSEQAGGTPGAANLSGPTGERESVAVAAASSAWRFDTGGDDLGTTWRDPGFDDSAWSTGSGSFATALVQNASFEAETFTTSPGYVSGNGAISSWSTLEGGIPGGESRTGINTPGALDPFANNGAVPDGANVAFIRGGPRSIAQDVSGLVPGERYLLSYRENGRSPTSPIGGATLGGIELVAPHVAAAVDSLDVFAQPYHHQVGKVFAATAARHVLQLSNHAGIGETILYDAVRLDPVVLHHVGNGAAAVDLPLSASGHVLILQAEVDPGTGGDGCSLGFKSATGSQSLSAAGVLWLSIEDGGQAVLRADETGGDHVIALATDAPVQAGTPNQVALVWQREAGRASVVINHETVFNHVDLGAIAGGGDGTFDPVVAGVGVTFGSVGGDLDSLAVAAGGTATTGLPIPGGQSTYYFRTEFEFSGAPADASLLLDLGITGGAAVYLNGIEIHRENLPAASAAPIDIDVLLPADALVSGNNVLAIELHTPLGDPGSMALQSGLTIIESNRGIARPALLLNEIAAAGASEFFVEIYNAGGAPVDLAGFSLNGFALPDESLPAGGFRAFTAAELGFTAADEEILFLKDAAGSVADAERVENRLRGRDAESDTWQHPTAATPNTANAFDLESRIVINEIHYHSRPTYPDPINGIAYAEDGTEWIELFNRSATQTVDLSGWSLRDAVSYDFPPGTEIAPKGYLLVTGAEFSGTLNNNRDRIHLRDADDNTADVVEYYDGAPWPKDADGNGASLELRHPDADNNRPGSWAASDESNKSEWQSFTYRGSGAEPAGSNNPNFFHEFLLGMLDAGEVLIDDISLVENPDGAAIELIQNGDFESDAVGAQPDKWRILGNHRDSHVVAIPGGKALKLVVTGRLTHTYNLASTTFASGRTINSTRNYEISFRARWLSGSPQVNTRLYFNRLARTHILAQPPTTGSPGAANSVLSANAAPAVSNFRHAPLVPAADGATRVHATITDASGIASALVHFNAGSGWITSPMSGNPAGEYIAILPGMAAGTVVQFYVEATANSGASVVHPSRGENSRALFRVGDRSVGARDVQTVRVIMLADEAQFMHMNIHTPSNARLGATVIYNDREIWYDAGVRLRGSPFGRRGSRVGWNIQFPEDQLFRGAHRTVAIDGGFSIPRGDGGGWIQVGPGVATNELIYNQMAHRAGGVPATFDDVLYVEAPRAGDDKLAQLKMARFGDIYKSSSFARGDEGTSFKFELIYHPRTTVDGNPESLKSVFDRVLGIDIADMGADKEAYRHNFWVQNHNDRDDYAGVISAAMAISAPPANLRAATDSALDVDNWLRVMAFQALTTTVDSYNNGLAHNMILYQRPADDKVMWIPWDVDHAFYDAPTQSIFGRASGDFNDVIQIPANRRAYCGHLLDLCNTGFNPAYIAAWVEHFNDVGEQAIAGHFTQWITNRRNHVLSQLTVLHPPQTFRITTNGGSNFSTANPQVTLRGKGWIDVREIVLGSTGEALDVHWIDNNDWEIVVALPAGANTIMLTALDHGGGSVGSDNITITNSGSVEPASASNLVVSEIMYHPADPSAAEMMAGFLDQDDFEFLELQNIGERNVDLSSASFAAGITFEFSSAAITSLVPGGRLLVVRNEAAFIARYGAGLPVAGEFQNDTGLSNGGERLRLAGAGGGTVRDFSYGDKFPWPTSADGDGFSLVLINPDSDPDHSTASNWRSSALPGGNPGARDAQTFSGDPDGDDDGDGLSNLMNYALGVSGPAAAPRFTLDGTTLTFTHRRNLGADDVTLAVEISSDLVTWHRGGVVQTSRSSTGDGTSILEWEVAAPLGPRRFARVVVAQ